MIHSRWSGTHYEAGLCYGQALRAQGINPLTHFQQSKARMTFTRASIPLYEAFYPAVLDEIWGMADGADLDRETVAAFLLSMYSFAPQIHCSCFAFCADGKTILGRNSDFFASIAPFCDSAFYTLEHAYAFIGNTTAWTEIEDGVNECGLAVGMTFICPVCQKPGFGAGMLVRCLLETCASTQEALAMLHRLPIASAQVLILADQSGDLAAVECNCEHIAVLRPRPEQPFVFTTNHFNHPDMQIYQPTDVDDWFSHCRYETLRNAFQTGMPYTPEFAESLLSGQMGFLCQYDSAMGADTVWSSLYDLTEGVIRRVEGNPSRSAFLEDDRLNMYLRP